VALKLLAPELAETSFRRRFQARLCNAISELPAT
jgi:hypothetical protein